MKHDRDPRAGLTRLIYSSLLVSLFHIGSSVDIGNPVRHTEYGRVKGRYHRATSGGAFDAEVYLGVPYARPPIGDLRFKMAQPPESWGDTVRDATIDPPWCIQFWFPNTYISDRIQNEDCLYINVIVPHKKNDTTLSFPVMIWIHGGSYQVGGMGMFPLDGLVNTFVSKGIVLVLLNYRLGPLGFMSLMNKECPGNFGLGDQLLAVQWVHKNIHHFDGDSNQVTLAGDSAGGAGISLLAMSHKADGVFHRAIIRSASALSPWALRSRNTDLNSHSVIRLVKCHSGEPAADFESNNSSEPYDSGSVMDCLRDNMTVEHLVKAWTILGADDINGVTKPGHKPMHYNHPFFAHTYFTPVVDRYMGEDSLVPSYPLSALSKHVATIPIMFGATTAETMGYVSWLNFRAERRGSIEEKVGYVVPRYLYRNPEQVKQAVYKEYFLHGPRGQVIDTTNELIQIASDQNFVSPILREAEYYRAASAPVYVYYFHHWNNQLAEMYRYFGIENLSGAPHGFDMAFLMQSTSVLDGSDQYIHLDSVDKEVTTRLATSIYNFIKFGTPNSDSFDLGWRPYKNYDDIYTFQPAANYKQTPSGANPSNNYKTVPKNKNTNSNIYVDFQRDSAPKTSNISGLHELDAATAYNRFLFWNKVIPTLDSLTLRSNYRFQSQPPQQESSHVEVSYGNELPPNCHHDCVYRFGFFATLSCSAILLLISCALGFIQCGGKGWSRNSVPVKSRGSFSDPSVWFTKPPHGVEYVEEKLLCMDEKVLIRLNSGRCKLGRNDDDNN